MVEKKLETQIIHFVNSLDRSLVFNQNNVPVPIMDKQRNFHGFRKNSHIPGLSDIGGVLVSFPFYLEVKTESTIKTFWKDVDAPHTYTLAKSTAKRVKRHKEQWDFLKRMEKCGALTGVVSTMGGFMELEWWQKPELIRYHVTLKKWAVLFM